MQGQMSSQKCFMTPTLLQKFQSKKLLSSMCTTNRLVLLTESQFIIYIPSQPKYKSTLLVDSQTIIRWVVNNNNQLCILYSNGLMQIRSLQSINDVKNRFGNIQVKVGKGFPQLYWQDEDIYVLGQNILEVVNIKKKQRKLYSQLVTLSQGKNLLGLIQSKLLDRQRIIIMIFSDKLTFNIVPIPITEMPFQQITRFYPLSCPKSVYQFSQQILPRQYLVLILDNKILRVYNIINMKPIIQIQYENTGHQFITLTSDRTKQFLLVTFITKKNKVTRNILYKINSKQYYRGKDIFKQNESFFQFQIQLDIKENLMLFTPREVRLDGNDFITLDVVHLRHNAKRNKGQIFATTLIMTLMNIKKKGISQCKIKNIQWKQLREWKDIITSYIQMKNTLEQIDFDIDQQQEEDFLSKSKNTSITTKQTANQNTKTKITTSNKINPLTNTITTKTTTTTVITNSNKNTNNTQNIIQNTNNLNSKNSSVLKPVKQTKQMYNLQNFTENNNKVSKQHLESKKIIEQQQKQMQMQLQRCQKLRVSLIDGAFKFKNQAINFSSHQDHQKKLQEQFYKFMAEYLREQQLDIDTDLLFRKKSQDYQKPLVKQEQQHRDCCEQHQFLHQHANKLTQNTQSLNQQSAQNKLKQQKALLTSKSSQQLAKNGNGSSYLNRTKSSANQQFQANISRDKHKNQSIVSIFSQNNRQIVTKSQENGQVYSQSESEDQLDKMALKITQAITKAFSPLQKKLDNLQSHIKRIQSIHINQLKKCQRVAQREVSELNNIDMIIKGYCQQLLFQFDKNLQNGLHSYWTKIQQVDKKSAKQRNKAIDTFGLFIDQQIKSRQQIFDQSRSCIQNSLSHLRKKMGNFFTYIDEQEDQQELYERFKRYKNDDYGFGMDIEDEFGNQQGEQDI